MIRSPAQKLPKPRALCPLVAGQRWALDAGRHGAARTAAATAG